MSSSDGAAECSDEPFPPGCKVDVADVFLPSDLIDIEAGTFDEWLPAWVLARLHNAQTEAGEGSMYNVVVVREHEGAEAEAEILEVPSVCIRARKPGSSASNNGSEVVDGGVGGGRESSGCNEGAAFACMEERNHHTPD